MNKELMAHEVKRLDDKLDQLLKWKKELDDMIAQVQEMQDFFLKQMRGEQ